MPASANSTPLLDPGSLGAAIAKSLFVDVPGAEDASAAIQRATTAILDGVLTQAGSPVKSLDTLFAPLIARNRGSSQDDQSNAPPLTERIAAALQDFLRAPFAAGPDPASGQPPPAVSAAQETPANLLSDLKALAKEEPFKSVVGVLRDSGIAPSAVNPVVAAAIYTPEKVAEVLRKMVQSFVKIYGPSLNSLVNYVEKELALSLLRSGVAAAIGDALDALPFALQSDMRTGARVHRILQEKYARLYRGSRDIVIERFNPNSNMSELVVVGPSASLAGASSANVIPLQKLAFDPLKDKILVFASLRGAMSGFKLSKNSWLRADLVDLGIKMIWEIKPTSSLASGVWQETLYRVTYNVIRLILTTVLPTVKAMPWLLDPGGYWSDATPQSSLGIVNSSQLLSNIPLGIEIAFPFQVAVLPGLIGYFVLRGPAVQFAILVAKAISDALSAALEKLKKLAQQLGQVLDPIVAFLKAVSEGITRFMIGFLLFTAILAAIVLLWPVELGAVVVASAVGATILLVVVVAGLLSGSTGDKASVTEVSIGSIRVSGIPVESVPKFLAEVEKQIQNIAAAAGKSWQQVPQA